MHLSIADPSLPGTLGSTLARGGVVIMPCDTIYGLIGIAPDTEASLRRIKGRGEKAFLQLIPSADWLPDFTASPLPDALRRYWPGALTVIFPGRQPAGGTVALRVPDDGLLLELMKKLGRPLFSTSVNRSGEPPLWRIADILERFESLVDLVVDAGDRPAGVPSTVLDVSVQPF
ncbi:MAG: L-threonylcarbamoyladenylate synthase, partial [Spirochaetales bacterium]|nr:L-threonylcarbamoyladenylate synthase [Spirochaetales bacterium]